MSQTIQEPKPLHLSAEEAMGLLDLCVLSPAELDPAKESILLKLSDLVRRYLTGEAEGHCAGTANEQEKTGAVAEPVRYRADAAVTLSADPSNGTASGPVVSPEASAWATRPAEVWCGVLGF